MFDNMRLFLVLAALAQSFAVQVQLQDGSTVTGFMDKYNVPTFLGIPFAWPPTGPYRFWDPIKPAKNQTINATEYPDMCMQPILYTDHMYPPTHGDMSEDCLYLNVYTPDVSGNYPVMFYIHGGGYEIGTANQFPGTIYAQDHNVVMVATNYRLGVFGFMYANDTSTGSHSVPIPGNAGLKDQLMALQWVKDHIKSFGGNPDNITIFGESAGSHSISLHILSPLSKGLFQRAIMQSGAAADAVPQHVAKINAEGLVSSVCPGYNESAYVCLQPVPADKLLKASLSSAQGFRPIIDGQFIPKDPAIMIENSEYNEVDIIIGFNSDEGFAFLPSFWPAFMHLSDNGTNPNFMDSNTMYDEAVTSVMTLRARSLLEPKYTPCVIDAVTQEYSQWTPPTTPLKRIKAVGDLVSDIGMKVPIINFANHAPGKVYMYEFTYVSNYSVGVFDFSPKSKWMGTIHAADLAFVFGMPFLGEDRIEPSETDKNVSRTFMKLWSDFATDGTIPPQWPAYRVNGNQSYIIIDAGIDGLQQYPRWEQLRFWNDYVPQLSKLGSFFYFLILNQLKILKLLAYKIKRVRREQVNGHWMTM